MHVMSGAMKGKYYADNHQGGLFYYLPNEIVLNIVSNLDDVVSLCRFAATCRRFLHLLSQLRSVSISLPFSLLCSEKALRWYKSSQTMSGYALDLSVGLYRFPDKLLSYGPSIDHVTILFRFLDVMMQDYPPDSVAESSGKNWDNHSSTTSWFFSRFVNLDSLEVTLHIPTRDDLPFRRFWWDAELHGTARPKGHIALVVGDNIGQDSFLLFQLCQGLSHIMLNFLIAKVLLSKLNTARSILTKDDKKGSLRLFRDHEHSDGTGLTESLKDWLLNERRMRLKFCYLPTSLDLDNNSSLPLEKTCFLFLSWVKEDDTTHVNDLIKTSLGLGQLGVDHERKELKEIVTKILSCEETKMFVGLR